MKNIYKELLTKVNAIIPIYQENRGDISIIIDKSNKEHRVNKKVKSVLNNIARLYHIDLIECRKKYSSIINKSNTLPIPINEEMTLIPLKMRKPIIESDGSVGYIRFEVVKSVNPANEKNTIITLDNDRIITCLVNYRTVCKNLKDTRIVKQEYMSSIRGESGDGIESFYDRAKSISTKADIALVLSEIKKIGDIIRNK